MSETSKSSFGKRIEQVALFQLATLSRGRHS
jgi:hypothetical protein